MPKRIQRSRKRGARLPGGAVVVTRPTKWGNPFRIGRDCETKGEAYDVFTKMMELARKGFDFGENEQGRRLSRIVKDIAELRGKDLACYCRLDEPCHADVLLALANRGLKA